MISDSLVATLPVILILKLSSQGKIFCEIGRQLEDIITRKFWEDNTDYKENDSSENSFTVACVFVAAVTFFTEPLSSNKRGIQT
jgi:hypothetical protein